MSDNLVEVIYIHPLKWTRCEANNRDRLPTRNIVNYDLTWETSEKEIMDKTYCCTAGSLCRPLKAHLYWRSATSLAIYCSNQLLIDFLMRQLIHFEIICKPKLIWIIINVAALTLTLSVNTGPWASCCGVQQIWFTAWIGTFRGFAVPLASPVVCPVFNANILCGATDVQVLYFGFWGQVAYYSLPLY